MRKKDLRLAPILHPVPDVGWNLIVRNMTIQNTKTTQHRHFETLGTVDLWIPPVNISPFEFYQRKRWGDKLFPCIKPLWILESQGLEIMELYPEIQNECQQSQESPTLSGSPTYLSETEPHIELCSLSVAIILQNYFILLVTLLLF